MLLRDLLSSDEVDSLYEGTVVDVTDLYSADLLFGEAEITRDELVNLFERGFSWNVREVDPERIFAVFP